jgi:pimeloyl-ACP methyl ester carboxylesterase
LLGYDCASARLAGQEEVMYEERAYNANGVTVNYAVFNEAGSGPPLVLLHGGSGRWQHTNSIIPALAAKWRVYAPDMRGHGKSDWVPGGYDMNGFADDIEAFLLGVVGEPAVLYGHSLGGQVAVQTAARRPGMVCGLIIGDAPFDRARLKRNLQVERPRLQLMRDLAGPRLPADEIRERLLDIPVVGPEGPVPARELFGEDSLWFDGSVETLRQHDPEMLDAVMQFDRMHATYDSERLLPLIECPTLILQADPALGGMSDQEVARGLALLRDGRAVKLVGMSHALFHPDPEPALRSILEFVEGL